jgi:hypothetical protein
MEKLCWCVSLHKLQSIAIISWIVPSLQVAACWYLLPCHSLCFGIAGVVSAGWCKRQASFPVQYSSLSLTLQRPCKIRHTHTHTHTHIPHTYTHAYTHMPHTYILHTTYHTHTRTHTHTHTTHIHTYTHTHTHTHTHIPHTYTHTHTHTHTYYTHTHTHTHYTPHTAIILIVFI